MSKLREILKQVHDGGYPDKPYGDDILGLNEGEQRIKDLMLEIIGPDEVVVGHGDAMHQVLNVYAGERNRVRGELREKVKAL